MKENRESRVPLERVTDAEIASAIRYLDPQHPHSERGGDRTDTVFVILRQFDSSFGSRARVHLALLADILRKVLSCAETVVTEVRIRFGFCGTTRLIVGKS